MQPHTVWPDGAGAVRRGAVAGMVILPRVPSLVAPFTREAERLLRAPGHFNWSTVTLLAPVVYVYAVEVERANWSAVLAGLAFWLMDWLNDIANALVLHFHGHAPLWTVTGDSTYMGHSGRLLCASMNGAIPATIRAAPMNMRFIAPPSRG